MGATQKYNTEIDGIKYSTETFTAMEGLILWPKILALTGGPLIELLARLDRAGKQGLKEDPILMGKLLASMSSRAIDPQGPFAGEGMLVLVDLLAKTWPERVRVGATDVPGNAGCLREYFDDHFARRMPHMLELCFWVCEVNFFEPSDESP